MQTSKLRTPQVSSKLAFMQLLMILPRIPFPEHDGAAIVMARTLKTLKERGHEVFVFALNPSRQRSTKEALSGLCSRYEVVDLDTDVKPSKAVRSFVAAKDLTAFGLDVRASYWVERFLDVRALEALRKFRQAIGDVDVVICETLFTAAYGAALHGDEPTGETRFILRAHNVEHRIQERLAEGSSTPIHRWYREHLANATRSYERAVAAHFDVVATMSMNDAYWFNDAVEGARIEVVHVGVDLHPPPASWQPDRLCFLGSLDWAPNLEGLLWFAHDVLPLIVDRHPAAQLIIGGRSAHKARRVFERLPHCTVEGSVDDAIAFRHTHGLSIVPLLSGSGVRIKILEALGAGCPVVTTALGNEGLPFSHATHLRVADSAEDFAEACVSVLQDPDAAMREALVGRELIGRTMSWEASIDTLLATVTF
jgi:polysaccharide biosynthesis protein PslH